MTSITSANEQPPRAPAGPAALADLAALPLMRAGTRLVGADSHDVTGGNNDGFASTFSYLYKDGDEWVLFEEEGPGCVYVVRSIGYKGQFRVYLDGAKEPEHNLPFPEVYLGKHSPFLPPLVAHEDAAHGSSWCYVPIPFKKSCRIATDEMSAPHFYNIFAHKYASEEVLDSGDLSASLEAACRWWSHPTQLPERVPDENELHGTASLTPGSSFPLVDISGSGAIRAIRLRFQGETARLYADLVVRAYWDGRSLPSVDSPVSTFFALGCPRAIKAAAHADPAQLDTSRYKGGTVKPQSLYVGQDDDGWLYCHFPMPYWRSARIELLNQSHVATVDLEYQVSYSEVPYPWAAGGEAMVRQPAVQKAIKMELASIRTLDKKMQDIEKRIQGLVARYTHLDPSEREKVPEMMEQYNALNADLTAMRLEWDRLTAADEVGYFHAVWRGERPLRPGEDFCVLDTRGCGHYVGCVLTFSSAYRDTPYGDQVMRSFLEGDARFYLDDSRMPLVASTGTEEFFNWGWYDMLPHDAVFQYPAHGYPLHVVDRQDHSVMYRFHVGEVVPYARAFRFDLEHGPEGKTVAEYSGTAFFYQREAPLLVWADELDVGNAASENEHEYVCEGLVREESHTIPYEGSYQLPKASDIPRDREHAFKDTGRVWSQSSEFSLRIPSENDGVRLRRRSYYGFGSKGDLGPNRPEPVLTARQRVSVEVDGVRAGTWHVTQGHARDTWRETEFELPRHLTRGKERIRVKLAAEGNLEWDEYTYWAYAYRRS